MNEVVIYLMVFFGLGNCQSIQYYVSDRNNKNVMFNFDEHVLESLEKDDRKGTQL